MFTEKCDVCGKPGEIFVVCSSMGPVSLGYCRDCLEAGVEPFGIMVGYIAAAGHFPDDINERYQAIVRKSLAYLGRTEEEFRKAVDEVIHMYDTMYDDVPLAPEDENDEPKVRKVMYVDMSDPDNPKSELRVFKEEPDE